MAKLTPNLGLFKYDETTDADVQFSFQQALNDNWDILDEKVLSGTGYEVGDIIYRITPTNDSGKHLLDGSLLPGDGIYADFVQYISGLYSTYPDLFCTESDWQSAVTTYGVCGKFVYNGTNNTVRLPKITGFIEGTTDVAALGDLIEAGLPNIIASATVTSAVGLVSKTHSTVSGAFTTSGEYSNQPQGSTATRGANLDFNASLSNPIYGNSDTVQPQAIKVLYYIVVATSTKTEIEVNIDEIATDLNGKVDKADLEEVQCVIETYKNGSSWYRIWSDGWCEQGGMLEVSALESTINLLRGFSNTNYNIQTTVRCADNYTTAAEATAQPYSISNYSFKVKTSTIVNQGSGYSTNLTHVYWQAFGYLAEGQY